MHYICSTLLPIYMVATAPTAECKKTKDSSPLGCYAMLIGAYFPAFHRIMVPSYQRLAFTCWHSIIFQMYIFINTTVRTSILRCGILFGRDSNPHLQHFLRLVHKLWKVTISYIMSVCPSARNNLSPTFSWNLILRSFRKSVEKTQVSLKSNKNNRYSTWRPTYIFDNISLSTS